jgi:hypothetical protein
LGIIGTLVAATGQGEAREMDLVDSAIWSLPMSQRLSTSAGECGLSPPCSSRTLWICIVQPSKDLHSGGDSQAEPNRVIGFAGIIHRLFDADLILRLGQRRPDWTFLIVGKEEATGPIPDRIEKLSNFYFAGFVADKDAPVIWPGCDLFMIPAADGWAKVHSR